MRREDVCSMLDVRRETDCQNDQLGDQKYVGCQGGIEG